MWNLQIIHVIYELSLYFYRQQPSRYFETAVPNLDDRQCEITTSFVLGMGTGIKRQLNQIRDRSHITFSM